MKSKIVFFLLPLCVATVMAQDRNEEKITKKTQES